MGDRASGWSACWRSQGYERFSKIFTGFKVFFVVFGYLIFVAWCHHGIIVHTCRPSHGSTARSFVADILLFCMVIPEHGAACTKECAGRGPAGFTFGRLIRNTGLPFEVGDPPGSSTWLIRAHYRHCTSLHDATAGLLVWPERITAVLCEHFDPHFSGRRFLVRIAGWHSFRITEPKKKKR